MRIDTDKIDGMVLALLYLTPFTEHRGPHRAWKGYDRKALLRPYEKGYMQSGAQKRIGGLQ